MAQLLSDADVGLAPTGMPPAPAMSDAAVGLAAPGADAKPAFDSPEYVQYLASKHGLDPQYVSHLRDAMMPTEGVKGIPILGGLEERAGAAASALAQPLTGAGAKGESISDRYAKNLAFEKELQGDFEAAHPMATMAAQTVGGTAATLPLASTGVGAKLLGLTGKTLPGQVTMGAASGAAINAADAAVRGEDPGTAAMVGGGLGIAAPVVGHVVGGLANKAANTVRAAINPEAEAARQGAEAVNLAQQARANTPNYVGNAMTPPEFNAVQAAGAPVMNMDLMGSYGRNLGRAVSNISPEAQSIMEQAVDDRFAGRAGRIADNLAAKFNYPNAFAQQQAITDAARAANTPAYQRAFNEAAQKHPQGLWDPVFEQLSQDPTVQAAIRRANVTAASASARQGFTPIGNPFVMDPQTGRMVLGADVNGTVARPTLQFWDAVKRELDGVGSFDARAAARALRSHIDTFVPSYGEARAGAAHFFGAENALEAGQNFITSRMQNDAARAAVGNMTDTERQLFADGAVSRLIDSVREGRNPLNNMEQFPAVRERLEIAVGPQRATEVEAMLRLERMMDQARGAVKGNSTTVRQLLQQGLISGGIGGVLSGGNPLNDPTAFLASALTFGAMTSAKRGVNAINNRMATELAKMLTSNNPAKLNLGLKMIAKNSKALAALRNADTALARAGAVQATPAQQGAAP